MKSRYMKAGHALAGLALAAALMLAAPPALAQTVLSLTATAENVTGAPDSIRIDVLRWSTDAERDQLLAAWTQPHVPAAGGGAGRGRGEGDGNGAAPGRGGRGGRGGGRAGGAEAPPPTPESSLTAALDKAPTVGHLWSSEVAGYALRYAVKLAGQNGSERVLFITDRRLGAWNDLWKPVGDPASVPTTNYEFSVIELRLNAKGEGEGKASLTGKIAVDSAAKTIALENYSGLPVVFKSVKVHK